MKILLIGASGLIGNQILQTLKRDHNIVGTHISFATADTVFYNPTIHDDRNYDVNTFSPNVIIHCGALTHVDYCEKNLEESYKSTVLSTIKLVELAQINGSKFIYLSTDYVFDGHNGPYSETDEPNPINIYGQHKLEAEKIVAKLDSYLILRVTNVYGNEYRNKNFIARIIEQIKNGKEINLTIPNDQVATPINALDVAKAVKVLLNSNETGIFHLASYDIMSRLQLVNVIKKHYPEALINITAQPTLELKQDAKRPLNGGLRNQKFSTLFPNFTFTSVDDFLNQNK